MILFLPIVVPFITVVLTLMTARRRVAQQVIALAGAVGLMAANLAILVRVARSGAFASQAGGWPPPYGITLAADLLSAILLALTGVVAVAVTVYSLTDVSREEAHFGYHPLAFGLLAGVCGAFLTGDLFNLYVWFEVMLIASFGLLVIGGGRAQIDGAVKYVGLNLIATVAFIAGVGLLYGATGALNMADLHGRIAGREGETAILVAAAFLVFAFASKAALFPTFFWLPASYHTPCFTTSALFAALLTKVGVYALIRVFTLVFDTAGTPIVTVLLVAALLSMGLGALGALAQTGLRRALGFTVIGSIGATILGLAIGTPLAIAAALFYLFQDMVVKASLFLGAGGVHRLAGSDAFAAAGGLWRAQPGFALVFLLPALSLAGVPPFPGFWAKLLLLGAVLEAGRPVLAFAVLAAALLTLFAIARFWAELFWKGHPMGDQAIDARLPHAMLVPLVGLTAIICVAGMAAGPIVAASQAAAAALVEPSAYLAVVLGDVR